MIFEFSAEAREQLEHLRIDREHRFVYRVDGERCTVLACRFHCDQ